jgi:hypothetical protein
MLLKEKFVYQGKGGWVLHQPREYRVLDAEVVYILQHQTAVGTGRPTCRHVRLSQTNHGLPCTNTTAGMKTHQLEHHKVTRLGYGLRSINSGSKLMRLCVL